MRPRLRALAIASLVLFACDGGEKKPADAPPAPASPQLRPLITPDEAATLLDAWQGAWVMPFRTVSGGAPMTESPIGSHEVWAIAGDTLTRWDGNREETLKVEVLAPCLLMKRQGDTSSAAEFAFAKEGLFVGALALGLHTGDRTVVCADRTAWTLDDGRCRRWERPLIARSDALRPEDAQCSVVVDPDGTKHFEVPATEDYSAKSVAIAGDLVRPDLAPPKPAQRFATMAEAQASLR